MQLAGKTVLLTGASGGIGQAIATRLAQAGAHLQVVGRDAGRLEQVRRTLAGAHQIVVADINTAAGRDELFLRCQENGLDVLINAAGVQDFEMFDRQHSRHIEQMLMTNLAAPVLLCHRLLPLMQQRQQAILVNIGSIFGSIGHPGFAAYCASKFGLRGFTEALQRELAHSPIRVLYLATLGTHTSFNSATAVALNRALGNSADSPERVAAELMKMLADTPKQRFMGWPENIFVRLNGLFPGIVHHALVKKLPIIRQHAANHEQGS